MSEIQTVKDTADKFRLAAAVALLLAGFVGYFMLAKQGAWVQWGVLLLSLAASAATYAATHAGRALLAFGRDAVREVRKVVWPERKLAVQITLYVFAFVVVMALFLWLTDKALEWLFYDLILEWKK